VNCFKPQYTASAPAASAARKEALLPAGARMGTFLCGRLLQEGCDVKRCAETLFSDYHRQHKLDVRVVRIFNTYGPRMHPNDGRVVSNFIMQALTGKDITVFGDGNQSRAFCFVDDMIEGFLRMMRNPEGFIGPVNLGNPNEFNILQLAEKVIRLTGSRSQIVFKPLPADDPTQRRPDIELARQKLGWQPTIELEEGLRRPIEYFKSFVADVPPGGKPRGTVG